MVEATETAPPEQGCLRQMGCNTHADALGMFCSARTQHVYRAMSAPSKTIVYECDTLS